MKRNCDEMDTTETDMITDESEGQLPTAKKLKDMALSKTNNSPKMDLKDGPNDSEQVLLQAFQKLTGSAQHSFVEREPCPGGYSLVNPDYVGKKNYNDVMELDANYSNASQFVLANMGNKIDQIGRQMKYLNDSLHKALEDSARDTKLHMAACNFVKKPGQMYHLYERPSGQQYFSMLSPEDWSGKVPHKFLGSWYLESDQSWTSAEERHTRYEGISFIRQLVLTKSIQ